MHVPIDIKAANVVANPFPHFSVVRALDVEFADSLLAWLENDAPWQLTIATFYEQYEFSLLDVALPACAQNLVNFDFLLSLAATFTDLFDAPLDPSHVDVTVHKLVPGQRIRIHNDFIPGQETHRLLIQLNRNWNDNNGGFLMLFSGAKVENLSDLVRPVHGSAFGFAISPTSYHAVAPVINGERYTLVYSFFRKAE